MLEDAKKNINHISTLTFNTTPESLLTGRGGLGGWDCCGLWVAPVAQDAPLRVLRCCALVLHWMLRFRALTGLERRPAPVHPMVAPSGTPTASTIV
jgi:hypothetical protein